MNVEKDAVLRDVKKAPIRIIPQLKAQQVIYAREGDPADEKGLV